MTREIPLTRGYVALVDDEDFDWLSQWKWQVDPVGRHIYAQRRVGVRENLGITKIRMHRQIAGRPKGFDVDHIDGNGINNCRANIRVCTHAENMRNRKRHEHSSFVNAFKGVHERGGVWTARISVGGVHHFLGRHKTAQEAALAYDHAAIKHHGKFACLNFPELNPSSSRRAA